MQVFDSKYRQIGAIKSEKSFILGLIFTDGVFKALGRGNCSIII